jgi:hypothetical protein
MKTRTIEEIEKAFCEMGMTRETWGRIEAPEMGFSADPPRSPQIFIRIETTTIPLEETTDAHLA